MPWLNCSYITWAYLESNLLLSWFLWEILYIWQYWQFCDWWWCHQINLHQYIFCYDVTPFEPWKNGVFTVYFEGKNLIFKVLPAFFLHTCKCQLKNPNSENNLGGITSKPSIISQNVANNSVPLRNYHCVGILGVSTSIFHCSTSPHLNKWHQVAVTNNMLNWEAAEHRRLDKH